MRAAYIAICIHACMCSYGKMTGGGGLVQEMGTFAWMAPEIILQGKAGFSADVYSFGVVLW